MLRTTIKGNFKMSDNLPPGNLNPRDKIFSNKTSAF